MTAKEFHAALMANTDAMLAKRITFDSFSAQQTILWRMIEASPRKSKRVHAMLRGEVQP
jgi:hypothetical protein